jgi:hypothetical protein
MFSSIDKDYGEHENNLSIYHLSKAATLLLSC